MKSLILIGIFSSLVALGANAMGPLNHLQFQIHFPDGTNSLARCTFSEKEIADLPQNNVRLAIKQLQVRIENHVLDLLKQHNINKIGIVGFSLLNNRNQSLKNEITVNWKECFEMIHASISVGPLPE